MVTRRSGRFVAGFLIPFVLTAIVAAAFFAWLGVRHAAEDRAMTGQVEPVVVSDPPSAAASPTPLSPSSREDVPPAAGTDAESLDSIAQRLESEQQAAEARAAGAKADRAKAEQAAREQAERERAAMAAGGGLKIVGGDLRTTPPEFPWPPPTPSTSYLIPSSYFAAIDTIGGIADKITKALETAGYVERRYYALPVPGVALVTRLEHINDDGSPASERWAAGDGGPANLYQLLSRLYFTYPGHYRVIVFLISKELPKRPVKDVTIEDAKAWLKYGLDDTPAEVATLPCQGARVLAYIYDFVSSDGHLALEREPPPAREQLTRAGVLTALGPGAH